MVLTRQEFEIIADYPQLYKQLYSKQIMPLNFNKLFFLGDNYGAIVMQLDPVVYTVHLHYLEKLKPLHYLFCHECAFLNTYCQGSQQFIEGTCMNSRYKGSDTHKRIVKHNQVLELAIPEHYVIYDLEVATIQAFTPYEDQFIPLAIGNVNPKSGVICYGDLNPASFNLDIVDAYNTFLNMERNGDYISTSEYNTIKENLLHSQERQPVLYPYAMWAIDDTLDSCNELDLDKYDYVAIKVPDYRDQATYTEVFHQHLCNTLGIYELSMIEMREMHRILEKIKYSPMIKNRHSRIFLIPVELN